MTTNLSALIGIMVGGVVGVLAIDAFGSLVGILTALAIASGTMLALEYRWYWGEDSENTP